MRILFLTRSFNGLAQRLFLELMARGHEVSVEFDIADSVAIEAVALYRPDLVVAPFLQRAIPEAIWRHHVCLVVHPGIVGDGGPSSLDWAIQEGERDWGVTVLQAQAGFDAGPVWAAEPFAMRAATKSSLYRREVTAAAVTAVLRAVERFGALGAAAAPLDKTGARGRWRPLMRQADRAIAWQRDDTATVLRKLHAADGTPGVLDRLFELPCHLFDARAEPRAPRAPAGSVVARRDDAVLRATVDGAVWIGHVRRADGEVGLKLPTALAFGDAVQHLPAWPASPGDEGGEIRWHTEAGVTELHFDFHNGAMSTSQCRRLQAAVQAALAEPARVLLLCGGSDFWSNGIHLNVIEAAESPADESWRNIEAMDDLAQALIEAEGRIVVAALQGNAGAGGAFLALAADRVWARRGVVLNPHYKNMGNLYGSEYWTYLLPRRLRHATPEAVMGRRLPMAAAQARQMGLVDEVFDDEGFLPRVRSEAQALAASPDLPALLQARREARRRDEAQRPLADYRAAELERMRRNFYGFDPSYHIARSNFVRRVAPSWTPRHLALHRRPA